VAAGALVEGAVLERGMVAVDRVVVIWPVIASSSGACC
jgi:hypothetical protein